MTLQPNIIVAGTTPDGASTVVAEGPAHATTVAMFSGVEFFLVWGTPDGTPTLTHSHQKEPTVLPFFAGPGGTRVLFARFAPARDVREASEDPEALAAEVAAKLPGLADGFDDRNCGMHATDTIDYGVCLDGELVLELDDGEERLVTPGTVVVQLGGRHAWHNRSEAHALMCFVGIGAERTD